MASSMHEAFVPCFSYRIVPSWDTAALAGATLLWTTCPDAVVRRARAPVHLITRERNSIAIHNTVSTWWARLEQLMLGPEFSLNQLAQAPATL